MVTPMFEGWARPRTLVAEIAEQFTGSELQFDVYAIDDCSSTDPDLATLALPPDSCVRDIAVVRSGLRVPCEIVVDTTERLAAESRFD